MKIDLNALRSDSFAFETDNEVDAAWWKRVAYWPERVFVYHHSGRYRVFTPGVCGSCGNRTSDTEMILEYRGGPTVAECYCVPCGLLAAHDAEIQP